MDGFFSTREMGIVQHLGWKGLARTTGAADSSDLCEQGLSTDLEKEVNKLVQNRATLRRGPAEIYAQHGFEKGVFSWG